MTQNNTLLAPALMVSDRDNRQLLSLVSDHPTPAMIALEEELSRARVVPEAQLPSDVVAMHSVVTVEDLESGHASELTLVFPREADIASHKISVLAPMGVALIGLRVGQTYARELPDGRSKEFRVKAVATKAS